MLRFVVDAIRESLRPQNMLNQLKDFAMDNAEITVDAASKLAKEAADKAKELLKKG